MSSDIILRVENVSKLYRLGTLGTGTFGGDVQRFWKTKILGQDDPFLKIGQTNDRSSKGKAKFIWALKDINFEVKRGEVLGLIGKNGAGKSTLLKLLSRITSPTTGRIKSAGRMASLLEVGTGFHPELSGRENIYLNGAILGMTKKEIQTKFDEIVDFSGCELYIDTPTKRYSSGMTVRLGFAVAAFLDPEILVVDEVLAVGDAEFQKKAIGKMKEVSQGQGRTVLFVSHNMDAVRELCSSAVILENGLLIDDRLTKNTKQIVNEYLLKDAKNDFNKLILEYDVKNIKDTYIKLVKFKKDTCKYDFNEEIDIRIIIEHIRNCKLAVEICDIRGNRLFFKETDVTKSGEYSIILPANFLFTGCFKARFILSIPNIEYIQTTDFLNFEITNLPFEFLSYSNLARENYPFGYVYMSNSIKFIV